MYCKKCGTEQRLGQKFCPKCGTPFVTVDDSASKIKDYKDDSSGSAATHNGSFSINQSPSKGTKSLRSYSVVLMVLALLVVIAGLITWIWKSDTFSLGRVADIFTSYEAESGIDGIPFKSSEKGKWGMLKPDGTILFEEEFKDIPTVAHDGRFYVRNGNGLWEIFTAEERPQKVGDEYVSLGDFYNGVAPAVRKNEKISIIDKEGNVIALLDKSGSKAITKMENFHYGYALFEAGDAVGILNTRGEILLEARKYCKIFHVAPKSFLALDMKYKDEEDMQNFLFDVIDPVGNKKGSIRMAKYNDIVPLDDGYIGIEQTSDGEKLYGIMDLNGEIIVRPTSKIKGLHGYRDGKFIFSDGDYWGVRTIEDEVLIRAKYDAIQWASSNMIWAISIEDGRQNVELVDLEGNKIARESYLDVCPFFDGKHAFVKITDKTWGIIDKEGEELKNVPDIYTIQSNLADVVIMSDYVDMDGIVSAIKMTPNGFGGFGINMTPVQLLKNYNENCEESAKRAIDPNSSHIDKLSYQKEVLKGVNLSVNLYYGGYMTEQGESYYDNSVGEWIQQPNVWTKEQPQYIRMTVSGNKIRGKTSILYKKLLVKAKTYGKVYKENDNACIIVEKNKNGLVLVNTGSEVWAMVRGMDSLRNENIEQYSHNETRKGVGYDEYVEPLDSIETYEYE